MTSWPMMGGPSSSDRNPLDYRLLGAMLESDHKLQPKPKTVPELTRSALAEKAIDSAVNDFRRRLHVCVSANGGHFKDIMR